MPEHFKLLKTFILTLFELSQSEAAFAHVCVAPATKDGKKC